MRLRPALLLLLSLFAAALAAAGCATLQEIAALRLVDFSLGAVAEPRLAGIDLTRVRSYRDLRPADAIGLAAAVRERKLPFEFTLHVDGANPADNRSAARLVNLEWTLFLDDRETVGGQLDREFLIEPGRSVDIPLRIDLDLLKFFKDDLEKLVGVALGVSGPDGGSRLRLAARPTITTPLGPMRYPGQITIARRGGAR